MIVVFGSINLDLIFAMPSLPQPGQTLLAQGLHLYPGGKGANQAVAAALDGAQVLMAGAVGSDSLKETALSGLCVAGVDVRRVVITDKATGTAAICTDAEGRNQIVVAPEANLLAKAEQVEAELLGPNTVLVLQMESDPAETAALIVKARHHNTRIILNLAPAAPLPLSALAAVDILVVNEDEADWLARHLRADGADAANLQRVLGRTIIRTLGGDGVEWAGHDGLRHHLHAPKVTVRDTTSAGDCFVGVLAAGLDRGHDLSAAIRRASIAASLSCTRAGGQISLPIADETDLALSAA